MYDDEVKDLSSARFRLLLRGITAALKHASVDFQTLNCCSARRTLASNSLTMKAFEILI